VPPEKGAMIFLGLASIWLIGFGLLRWLFPRPIRRSVHNVLLFSLGIGAGTGIVSCLWFVFEVAAGPNFPAWAWVGACAAIAGLAIVLTRRQGTLVKSADGPAPPLYLRVLFWTAIALAAIAFVAAVSANPHGEQGAWSIWNLRARFLFRGGAFWRDAFSRDLSWSHPGYPLLVPGLITLCWKLAGQESTDAPIAIAFLFVSGTAGVLISTLASLRGKTQAILGGILLLGTASFLSLSTALYGDVPLSFYILATVALLCLQDRHPEDLRFGVLAGLMAGFAAWTRNEGALFLAAVVIARAIAIVRFHDRQSFLRSLLTLLAGLAAPLAVVIYFKTRVAGPDDAFSVAPPAVLQNLADPSRWILTIEALVAGAFKFGAFLVPIALFLALYWYFVRFQVDSSDGQALTTGATALLLTLAAQLLMNILFAGNLPVELNTSVERYLLQLWPAALLLFFLATGQPQLNDAKQALKTKAAKKSPSASRRRIVETR
jgi:hypothetical protein